MTDKMREPQAVQVFFDPPKLEAGTVVKVVKLFEGACL